MKELNGVLTSSGTLTGTLEINTGYRPGKLQEKDVIPAEVEQVITADAGYAGLSSVTVNAIPSNYGKITYDGIKILVE